MVTDSYISGRCRYRHAPVKASTTSVQYAYSDPNDNSRLTSMTYPNGRILIYGYNDNALDDAIGRLDYLADAGGAMAGHLADYTYLGLDTPVSEAYGNSVTENITLTDFGQTAEINYANTTTSTSTDDFQYGYDADGNVLYKDNVLSSSNSELYHANSTTTGDDNSAYDPLNRLVAFARGTLSASGDNGSSLDTVASASATQNWSLNAVGDQSSVTTNGTTTSNATNSQNQLTGFGSVGLAYDNNGDTTTDENGHSLVYDAWSRLVSVSSGSTLLATYSYDGTGRRVTEAENSVTTDLYYSNQWQVLEERQSGTVTAQYVWGPFYVNQIVLRDSNPTSLGELGITSSGLSLRVYFQQDANWNVTAVTDVSGSVLMRLEYSAYGVATVLNADWSTGTAPFGSADAYGVVYGFQGGRYDPASGKINFQRRDYDAVTCVWQEQDPAGYVDGPDVYTDVCENPIGYGDPTGQWSDTNPPTGWRNDQPFTRMSRAQLRAAELELWKTAQLNKLKLKLIALGKGAKLPDGSAPQPGQLEEQAAVITEAVVEYVYAWRCFHLVWFSDDATWLQDINTDSNSRGCGQWAEGLKNAVDTAYGTKYSEKCRIFRMDVVSSWHPLFGVFSFWHVNHHWVEVALAMNPRPGANAIEPPNNNPMVQLDPWATAGVGDINTNESTKNYVGQPRDTGD